MPNYTVIMYVYEYEFVCMHTCMCMHVCMYVHVCVSVHVRVPACMPARMCGCVHMYVCMYVCMRVCMHACVSSQGTKIQPLTRTIPFIHSVTAKNRQAKL
jgi:hypothetical protein